MFPSFETKPKKKSQMKNRPRIVNSWDLEIGICLDIGHWDFRYKTRSALKYAELNTIIAIIFQIC